MSDTTAAPLMVCCLLSWLPIGIYSQQYMYRECFGNYCFAAPGINSKSDNGNQFLMSYPDATAWCRKFARRLVTVESKEKHQALVQFMLNHEYNSDAVWIGVDQMTSNQWMWVNGSSYTGLAIVSTATNELPFSAYTFMDGTKLKSSASFNAKGYICQFEGSSNCSSLFEKFANRNVHSVILNQDNLITSGDKCFIIFPLDNPRATKAWHDARSICQFHGGDLAVDNSILSGHLLSSGFSPRSEGYWIGLQQGPLVWISGTGPADFVPLSYAPFARSSPRLYASQSCIVLLLDSRHTTFGDQNCTFSSLCVCDDDPPPPLAKNLTSPESQLIGPITKGQLAGIVVGCAFAFILSITAAVLVTYYCATQKCRRNDDSARKPDPLPTPDSDKSDTNTKIYVDNKYPHSKPSETSTRVYTDNCYTSGNHQ